MDDVVTGVGRHSVALRWHLAPGCELDLAAGGAVVRTADRGYRVLISAPGRADLTAGTSPVAVGFGHTASAPVLTCRVCCTLPVQLSTSFQRAAETTATSPTASPATVGGAA